MAAIKLGTDAHERKLEIVRSFLGRFEDFKRTEAQAIPMLGQFLARFNIALPELKQKEDRWEMDAAPNFNIFRVLRLQRRETKLHSRFLAELLDPRGSHSQGAQFLTAFLDLGEKSGLRRPPERPKDLVWEITTEEVTKWGRLDIVVRCSRVKFVMVIENKVDAREGAEQLFRYHDWLQKYQATFRNLVFLTPDGRTPETIAASKCLCFSYREHIDDWLREANREIQAPHLRFALDQYLQVVESL